MIMTARVVNGKITMQRSLEQFYMKNFFRLYSQAEGQKQLSNWDDEAAVGMNELQVPELNSLVNLV
jgi:hypothetical protein